MKLYRFMSRQEYKALAMGKTINTSQMKLQKVDGKSAKVVNPLLSLVRQ